MALDPQTLTERPEPDHVGDIRVSFRPSDAYVNKLLAAFKAGVTVRHLAERYGLALSAGHLATRGSRHRYSAPADEPGRVRAGRSVVLAGHPADGYRVTIRGPQESYITRIAAGRSAIGHRVTLRLDRASRPSA